jgi:hypothetical protein
MLSPPKGDASSSDERNLSKCHFRKDVLKLEAVKDSSPTGAICMQLHAVSGFQRAQELWACPFDSASIISIAIVDRDFLPENVAHSSPSEPFFDVL